jgi:hypothetical protein
MSRWCFVVVMLVMPACPDPIALVSQLGSKSPCEREAAFAALEAIGGKALTALRAACDGQDPAARSRAAVLIRKIEGEQLVRPSLVSLNYRDRPMSEVIHDISAKTGCRLRIYEVRKDWLEERITLHKPDPLPFWKAVDSLCEAGRFQYNLGIDAGGTCVAFFRDETSGPASDHGAFRVQLEQIFFNGRYRRIHLGRGGPSLSIVRDKDQGNSSIGLRVMVEPRMMIRNDGSLKGLSVMDDRGQSLLPADPESKQPHKDFGFTPAAYVLGQVPLKRGGQPGRVIRKLRGIAPVVVAARRSGSLVIPLDGAAGRSHQTAESVLTIETVRKITTAMKITIKPADPDWKQEKLDRAPQATEIELTLRPIDRSSPPPSGSDVSEHQFEVVDAAGRVWKPSPWWLSDSGAKQQGGKIRVHLIPIDGDLSPWPGDLAGAKLRYYDMTVMKVNVPFEFADVVLP